jgi:hypothetical protein
MFTDISMEHAAFILTLKVMGRTFLPETSVNFIMASHPKRQ